MPLLTRQQIIDQYGIDPVDADAIVPKGEMTEQIEVKKPYIELPPTVASTGARGVEQSGGTLPKLDNRETPSAPINAMAVSGAIRGYVSDPLLLAGTGVAMFNRAVRGKDATEAYYKDGGLEAVNQHLTQKQQELQSQGLEPDEIRRKLLEYQTSPEFFSFNTDHMVAPYSQGMKMAAGVNGLLGIKKTPEQETWQDEAVRMLGSVVVPSPGIVSKATNALAKAAGLTAPRAIDLTAKGIDALVLPGTSTSHYTPGVLGASAAVGAGLLEGQRYLTGEPSVTAGTAFTDRDPTVGGFLAEGDAGVPQQRIGDVASQLAGLATVAGGLSVLLRGKVRPDVNTIKAGPAQGDILARNAEKLGVESPQAPTATQNISSIVNVDAEIERLGRDAATRHIEKAQEAGIPPASNVDVVEQDIQAALGLKASRASRDAATDNLLNGQMPDNQRMSYSINQLQADLSQLDQGSVDRFFHGMVSLNARDTRIRAGRTVDDPATRPSMQAWSDVDLDSRVKAMMDDPNTKALYERYTRINQDLNRLEHRSNLVSDDIAQSRNDTPWHTRLFEYRDFRYNAKESRQTEVDPDLGLPVNQTIDPFQNLVARSVELIDRIQTNEARKSIINTIRGIDPDGYFVKEVKEAGRNTVTYLDVGARPRHFEFTRPEVAQAMKFGPLAPMNPVVAVAGSLRRGFQWLTTGPIFGGIPTAIQSFGYDIPAAFTTARAGRSFGYMGMKARIAAGDNQSAHALIDSLQSFDPVTGALQSIKQIPVVAWYKTVNRVGEKLMDAAIQKGHFAQDIVGRAKLLQLGGAMTRTYEESVVGLMQRNNATPPHAMLIDTYGTRNRMEVYLKKAMNAGRDTPAWRQLGRTVFEPYMALLDTIHNAPKYAYFTQNYEILKAKYKGKVPQQEIERLAEESRRLSGDLQGIGSEGMQGTLNFIPYGNITAQSTRHIYKAAFEQGGKHTFDVGLRLMAMPILAWAGYKAIEEMGGKDWYWNGQNSFERIGMIQFPSPWALARRVLDGQMPRFDPNDAKKYVSSIRIAPEFTPITQTILVGMEHLFGTERGNKTSPLGDIGHAAANAAGIGSIPLINLGLSFAGANLDLLAGARGAEMLRQNKPDRSLGIWGNYTPGGVPIWLQDASKSVFGLGADISIGMADTGLQHLERGKSPLDALLGAGEEGYQRAFAQRMPFTSMWGGEHKVYNQTPASTRIYGIEKMKAEFDRQFRIEAGKSMWLYPERMAVVDPDVQTVLMFSHGFLSRGGYRKAIDVWDNAQAGIKQLESMKGGQLSPNQINKKKQEILMNNKGNEELVTSLIDAYEQTLRANFGPVFNKYGLEPNSESVNKLLMMATRRKL